MNIKLDNEHAIKSDPRNVVLVEVKIPEGGGKEYDSPIGYYSSVELAFKGYLRMKVNSSQATNIQELLQEVREIKNTIENALKGV